MDLAKFREYCLSKANAAESTPFGRDVLVFRRTLGGLLGKIANFLWSVMLCGGTRSVTSLADVS